VADEVYNHFSDRLFLLIVKTAEHT